MVHIDRSLSPTPKDRPRRAVFSAPLKKFIALAQILAQASVRIYGNNKAWENPLTEFSLATAPRFNKKGRVVLGLAVFAIFSGVLKSDRAVQVSILNMEKKYDRKFKRVFDAIYQLMNQEKKPKHEIGFRS